MSSSTVVRMQNGGTIAVRTGILRGAGPQGPIGPQGPVGAVGPAGPVGPAPVVSQMRSHLTTSASVPTGGDATWYDAAMPAITDGSEPNDLIAVPSDPYNFKFVKAGTYFGYLRVRFEPRSGSEYAGVGSASRRARVVDAASLAVIAEASVAAATTEPTIVAFPLTFPNVDVTRGYKVQVYSDDTAGISVTYRSMRLFQINAGPPGPAGPIGPVGLTGPQGPAGAPGSAGGGYTTFDAVVGGTDSAASPASAGIGYSTDQGLPYPLGTALPVVPGFLKLLIGYLETRVVGQFNTATDRSTKRSGTRYPGELTYLKDNGNLQHREKSGADIDVARVLYSSATPPTGAGQAAPGVLWVQY